MKKWKLDIVVALIIFSSFVTSCSPKPPYEIKSPCVSIDSDNPWVRTPCSRKVLNRDIA